MPEVASGAAHELDGLRGACDVAVGRLAAASPDEIVVLGAAGPAGGLRQFGVEPAAVSRDVDAARLPLSLTIGDWLLDRAGWTGPRRLHAVPDAAIDGTAVGNRADGDHPGRDDLLDVADGHHDGRRVRTAVLVMADGTARRSAKGPGYIDPRAEPFDAEVAAALATGSPAALAGLDAHLAHELLATGCPVWHLVGGLAAGRLWDGNLLYADAPYGVGYTVATWQPA